MKRGEQPFKKDVTRSLAEKRRKTNAEEGH